MGGLLLPSPSSSEVRHHNVTISCEETIYRTHLKVSGWQGDPIQFGDRVSFVCDRNTYFEDEEVTSVDFTCQDDARGGHFDAPDDTAWPQCVRQGVI